MARLEAQAKALYYPTPESEVNNIANLIDAPSRHYYSKIAMLDPCCGTGAALEQLAKRCKNGPNNIFNTYGVELSEERGMEATDLLDNVVVSDLMDTTISHSVFDLLFLNPPYDYDEEDKRLEHKFITKCEQYLKPGGILAFIIPQEQLKLSARFIASKFKQLKVFSFNDGEYERFKQIVVMGVKKTQEESLLKFEQEAGYLVGASMMRPMTFEEYRDWQEKEGNYSTPYILKPYNQTDFSKIICVSRNPNHAQHIMEARHKGLWDTYEVSQVFAAREEMRKNILMPLRKGHIAMMMAAGALNNAYLITKQGAFLVKGQSRKIKRVTREEHKTTETDTLQTKMYMLNLRSGVMKEVK